MVKIITILLSLAFFGAGCQKPMGATEQREVLLGAIQDTVKIGQENINIAYTDENAGEYFIIKVDKENYYSFGGGTVVNFSITNVSMMNQVGDIAFLFGGKQSVRIVEKFLGNRVEYTIPATATTTAQDVIKANWESMIFKKDYIAPSVNRKDTKGREINKVFVDNFKSGETKYYRAVVVIPYGITENEWFIEAFGESSYGHLDPNNWTYTQSFDALNDGALGGQDLWSGTDADFSVGAAYKYGSSVKGVQANGVFSTNRTIDASTDGTVYFAFQRKADGTAGNGIQISIDGGSTGAISLISKANDSVLYYWNAAFEYLTFFTPTVNTWYIISLTFNCATDTFDLNYKQDGGSWQTPITGATFRAAQTSLARIIFANDGASSQWYIDEIGANDPNPPPPSGGDGGFSAAAGANAIID